MALSATGGDASQEDAQQPTIAVAVEGGQALLRLPSPWILYTIAKLFVDKFEHLCYNKCTAAARGGSCATFGCHAGATFGL